MKIKYGIIAEQVAIGPVKVNEMITDGVEWGPSSSPREVFHTEKYTDMHRQVSEYLVMMRGGGFAYARWVDPDGVHRERYDDEFKFAKGDRVEMAKRWWQRTYTILGPIANPARTR